MLNTHTTMPRDHAIHKMPKIASRFFQVQYIMQDFYDNNDNDAVRSEDKGSLNIPTIKMMKNGARLKTYTTMPRDYVI